jgi:hypothetical protein
MPPLVTNNDVCLAQDGAGGSEAGLPRWGAAAPR